MESEARIAYMGSVAALNKGHILQIIATEEEDAPSPVLRLKVELSAYAPRFGYTIMSVCSPDMNTYWGLYR